MPPGFIPNKIQYMASDLKLLSEYFEVPMVKSSKPYESGIQATYNAVYKA